MDRASDIIGLIPEVKPRVAMRVIKEAIFDGRHGFEKLSAEDRKLALQNGWVLEISPIGGRILLELFEAGLIPQNKANASRDLSQLRAYAATEPAYREHVREAEARKEAYQLRIKEIARDPDSAHPSEITADLINKVFLERFGYRHFGELKIAGLSCHKGMTAAQYSNSGKTSYPGEVYCYWFDHEGTRHGENPEQAPRNRRNDPSRNWGLGRE